MIWLVLCLPEREDSALRRSLSFASTSECSTSALVTLLSMSWLLLWLLSLWLDLQVIVSLLLWCRLLLLLLWLSC